MGGTVDDIDARIVAALIRDARASYVIIGNEVGLSAPAVKRRVDRLRAAGAIAGFSARRVDRDPMTDVRAPLR